MHANQNFVVGTLGEYSSAKNFKRDSFSVSLSSESLTRRLYEWFVYPYAGPLTLRLIESSTLFFEEVEKQRNLEYFIIHPCSRFRFALDFVLICTLFSNVIIIPIELAFFAYDEELDWIIFNIVSSAILLTGVFLNIFSGAVTTDQRIILDRKEVIVRYARSWLIVDLVSALPFDLIFVSVDRNYAKLQHDDNIVICAKLLGLIKLLRVAPFLRYVFRWQDILLSRMRRIQLSMINLVLILLLMAHINGCLLFYIPMLERFPKTSWVIANENDFLNKPWGEQYIWSLYSAICLMTTISFGSANPVSIPDVLLLMYVLVSSAIIYAMIVAEATALIMSLNHTKLCHQQHLDEIEKFMRFHKLPKPLCKKINDYFETRYQGTYFDEDKIISELSESLRNHVLRHNCRSLVLRNPFFQDADADFVEEIIARLNYELLQPNDVIIKAGTLGKKMYFLQSGNVRIVLPSGKTVTQLSDGAYFGEICLLQHSRRNASVIAESYCTLYSLTTQDFHEVLSLYPAMRQTFEEVATQRLLENSRLENEESENF